MLTVSNLRKQTSYMYENPSYQGVLGLTFGNSAYLVANDQFDANQFYITASTNQKRDVFALMVKYGEVRVPWGPSP